MTRTRTGIEALATSAALGVVLAIVGCGGSAEDPSLTITAAPDSIAPTSQ